MSRSTFCQAAACDLLASFEPVVVTMLEASAASEADFSKVEQAVGTAMSRLRMLSVSRALSASIACARCDYTCPTCGRRMSGWGKTSRSLMTSQGEASIDVPRYRCTQCQRSYTPVLEANGLCHTRFTLGAKERIVEEASDAAYAEVSERLPEMDLHVSAKEVDRLVCQAAQWHRDEQGIEIAWHRQRCMQEMADVLQVDDGADAGCAACEPAVLYDWSGWEGQTCVEVSVDCGKVRSPDIGPDGTLSWFEERSGLIRPAGEGSKARAFHTAGVQSLDDVFECLSAVLRQRPKWVTQIFFVSDDGNGLQSRAGACFPRAVLAVDIYHAGKHVQSGASAAWGADSAQARALKINPRQLLLEHRGAQKIIRQFTQVLRRGEAIDPDGLRLALRYLWRNRHKMKYAQWNAQGLPIGSSAMESAIKQVCVSRLRRPGMMWTKTGADGMLRVRSASLSATLPVIFQRRRAAARQELDKFFTHRTYCLAA